MNLQLVRHATLLVEFHGRRILVDPMLSEAEAMEPVRNAANDRRIPMVALPMPASEVVQGLDAILITHVHRDHFDETAAALLPQQVPVFCQPGDETRLRDAGFETVLPVADAVEHAGIEFVRTGGKHGLGVIGQLMGQVSGFVLRAPDEPTLYVAGDTIWCGCVAETLETFRPDVVVVNAGAAQFLKGSPITMDGRDVARVCETAPGAAVIAVHMDTVNHCLLTRAGLRAYLQERGLTDRVQIPNDGERLQFPVR
ncbi:MAG TPA: MBL fold metallo-hydrolase [Symbiobacteriaceae bacterium]|nr:MBL fold metallo-hydrolase [Symbiobacteriaceae bacterium]